MTVDKSRTANDNTSTNEQLEVRTKQFVKDGFLCLSQEFPSHIIQEWNQFAVNYFEECFQHLHQNGHTPFPTHAINNDNNTQYALGLGIKHGFREIVMRSPGRYELSLLHCPPSKLPSIETIQNYLYPLVPKILGANHWDEISLIHQSLVVSTPNSPDQGWHADGGHVSLTEHLGCHVLNVFLPLVDVPLERGPTEFRPGSQVYTRNLAPMMLAARARKELRAPVTPELQVGDVLLFDYRVLHRGRRNQSSANRPILVLTYSKPWYKDVCNFPKRSMYEDAVEEESEEA